ncbi:DUF5957 family protein [Paenibacillus thermotolerans]|uniref:DUF5957 family protein n=1 Tax=Paenibacillus thermotolerans TaxID=3027807 RepID=UPI002368D4C5|nr:MULTISPECIES: DUF5957 family protein [unclassified Paenibacillus]
MNKLLIVVLALIGGFIVGVVLSELIAVVGKLMFDRAVGIKYLPVYTAVLSAVIVPILRRRPSC